MDGDVHDQIFRKSEAGWRSVPRITRDAVSFVRKAAPGHLERVWALHVLSGIAAALSVGASAVLVRRLLQLDNGRSALSSLMPVVAVMVALMLVNQAQSVCCMRERCSCTTWRRSWTRRGHEVLDAKR